MSTHKKPRPVLHVNPGKIVPPAELRNTAVPPARPVMDRGERIAVAAYFLAEKRNFSTGRELEDWLAAEQDVDATQPARDATAGHG